MSEPDEPDRAPGGDPPVTPHPKHLAADRAGKGLLQAAHRITEGMAEAGVADDGVVVLRTDGPRHSLAALEALLDEALAEDERSAAGEGSGAGEQRPAEREPE